MQIVHFTPPQIARMLKVNESTVKRWIDRGILPSERTSGGHRRVREEDVRAFLESQQHARKHSYVLTRYAKRAEDKEVWRRYFDLHKHRHPADARELLTSCFIASGSVATLIQTVVTPTLVAIGEAWRGGTLDIADEHRMTFLIRSDLVALDMLLPTPKEHSAPHLMLACVPRENHELSLMLLALVARESGWRTTVLGINVPERELAREASVNKPDAVALAKAYSRSAGIAYVQAVRALPELHDVPLIVGGGGWSNRDQQSLRAITLTAFAPSLDAFRSLIDTYAKQRRRA